MNNTANKKDIFYIVVLILTFITVVVGATFAIYTHILSQEEGTSAVYTGTLSIEYLSGEIINVNKLYPREEPTIETTKNVYKNNFKVTNTGSLDSRIEIRLVIDNNNFGENSLPGEAPPLKYSLYNSEEKIKTGWINKEGIKLETLADNIELTNNTTEEYTLLIWIDDNGENQNHEMDKKLEGRIEVKAMQEEAFKK